MLLLTLLAATKLACVWGEPVTVVHGPHDDSLYVDRAHSLIQGEGFGRYSSATLLKHPGLSLWLAVGALLGLPLLLGINLLCAAAGLYLCFVLRQAGAPRWAVATGFALYLFNPFTFDVGWTRVLREPLATGLLTLILASLLGCANAAWRGARSLSHLAIFALSVAFASLLREEDILILLIPLAAGVFAASALPAEGRQRWKPAATLAFAPLVAAALAHGAALGFVAHHYGRILLNDFSGGEYPRMIAALRSVQSRRENRYVMISQETLAAVRREVPRLESVIRRLPQPGRSTVSCEWLGVCTEWANGWLPFWIKDAAYEAGLTPDLPSAQTYYRAVREDIEAACASGRLACVARGNGLIPPFELRWTRAFVREAGRLVSMLAWPEGSPRQVPTSVHGPKLDALFAAVTASPVKAAPASVPAVADQPGALRSAYGVGALLLLAAAFGGSALVLWTRAELPRGPLAVAFGALAGYVALRLVALAYIAIYMGRYDPRMIMSSHMLLVFIAPCIIALAFDWPRGKTR